MSTYDNGVVTQTRPDGQTLVRQPSGSSAVIAPAADGGVHVAEYDPSGQLTDEYDTTLDADGWPVPPEEEDIPVSLLAAAGGAAALAVGAAGLAAAKGRGATTSPVDLGAVPGHPASGQPTRPPDQSERSLL